MRQHLGVIVHIHASEKNNQTVNKKEDILPGDRTNNNFQFLTKDHILFRGELDIFIKVCAAR